MDRFDFVAIKGSEDRAVVWEDKGNAVFVFHVEHYSRFIRAANVSNEERLIHTLNIACGYIDSDDLILIGQRCMECEGRGQVWLPNAEYFDMCDSCLGNGWITR